MQDVWLVEIGWGEFNPRSPSKERRHIYAIRVFSTQVLARYFRRKTIEEWTFPVVWASEPAFLNDDGKFEYVNFIARDDEYFPSNPESYHMYILIQHEAVDHMINEAELQK